MRYRSWPVYKQGQLDRPCRKDPRFLPDRRPSRKDDVRGKVVNASISLTHLNSGTLVKIADWWAYTELSMVLTEAGCWHRIAERQRMWGGEPHVESAPDRRSPGSHAPGASAYGV